MEKELAKQEVRKLVEKFESYSKSEIDSMPEEQIKNWFIEPLLEALGWRRYDLSKEERVLKGRADYILRIGNQDKLVIEAKKTKVSLSEEEGRQAVSYAYHKNIKFAVLTNFKQIRVYHALSNIKNIDKNLLKDDKGYFWLDCKDFIEQFERLWLLSKESFESDKINELLKNVDKRLIKPIDESILADLLEFRELLSKDLKNKRNHLDDLQIDEIVQILIDRLIFMRSVEDRGLEGKDFLLTIIDSVQKQTTDKNLWALLKEQFRRFDSTYNSKLFAEGILDREGAFADNVLIKMIKGLYYGSSHQQERYMFDIIPVDLLGSIYEQYLGVVLRGTDKRVKLDLQSGKRKKMGIYYTPSYIVEYIVKNTLREYVKDKNLDEILKIRIVDPACGSGSFLIRAFSELCGIVEERLKNGEKSKDYLSFQKWNGKLSLGEKKQILLNCIYGVDLDEKAVELARLNLLLKCLEEETRETQSKKLPNLSENIRNGNSLISDSRYDKAFNWNAQFKDVFADGGFDVVVGNPPYFNLQTLKDKSQIKHFEKEYSSYRGKADILYLFIEKDKSLLKDNGVLGIIVANYFLRSHYADRLRKLILENYQLNKITDFGSIKVFGDANVDTCIILAKKGLEKDRNYNYGLLKNEKQMTSFLENSLNEKEQINKDYEIKTFNQNNLTDSPWRFDVSIDEKLIPLSKICYIGKGVATGNDKIFVIDKNIIKKFNIEKEIIDELVDDSSIDRYSFELSDKLLLRVKRGEDISKFKNALRYLETKKKELQKRYAVKKEGLKWYEIVRYNKDLFSSEVKEQIYAYYRSKYNKFAYSDERFVTLTTTFVLTPKPNYGINLKYLLGILNSKFMQNYSINNAKKMGSCFEYSSNFIGSMPIKLPSSKSQEEKIIGLVERMIELQKKIHSEGVSGNEKTQLEQQIRNVDYEIDEEVYKLYGISGEEKRVIERVK